MAALSISRLADASVATAAKRWCTPTTCPPSGDGGYALTRHTFQFNREAICGRFTNEFANQSYIGYLVPPGVGSPRPKQDSTADRYASHQTRRNGTSKEALPCIGDCEARSQVTEFDYTQLQDRQHPSSTMAACATGRNVHVSRKSRYELVVRIRRDWRCNSTWFGRTAFGVVDTSFLLWLGGYSVNDHHNCFTANPSAGHHFMKPLQHRGTAPRSIKKPCSADTVKHFPPLSESAESQDSGPTLHVCDAHRALRPGQNINHYELVEIVGEGSFGVVWKAVDTQLGRQSALALPGSAILTRRCEKS